MNPRQVAEHIAAYPATVRYLVGHFDDMEARYENRDKIAPEQLEEAENIFRDFFGAPESDRLGPIRSHLTGFDPVVQDSDDYFGFFRTLKIGSGHLVDLAVLREVNHLVTGGSVVQIGLTIYIHGWETLCGYEEEQLHPDFHPYEIASIDTLSYANSLYTTDSLDTFRQLHQLTFPEKYPTNSDTDSPI